MQTPALPLTACLWATAVVGQSLSNPATPSASEEANVAAIQQIEDEWLKTERSTDLAALEGILADEVGTKGPAPGKTTAVCILPEDRGT